MKLFAKMVVVEGPDKVGKQTQSQMLAHVLRRYGDKVKLVEVPYNDGSTYRLIYRMLKNGQAKKYPNLFQFVQFLNKFIFQRTVLLWLRITCACIVLDRWKLSAIVYGDATGVNPTFNRMLYGMLKDPDVTVILHGSSFKRQEADDVYEKDNSLQTAVRNGYYEWAQEHPENHDLIDNQGSRDEVHERIMNVVSPPDCSCGARYKHS